MKKYFLDCTKNKMFCNGREYPLSQIKYIVIHNTGNSNDTSKANAEFFKNNKTRYCGATFIIGRKGVIYQCSRLEYRPYAVGGKDYSNFERTIFPKPTNQNTISIELCDIVNKDISKKQLKALKMTIKDISKECPNIVDVIRHYDVNGKPCPQRYIDDKKWFKLHKKLKKFI